MRLVLELRANGNFSRQDFERKYRTAIHGLCHNFFSVSIFPAVKNIHDSKAPGLFCFSGLSGKFGEKGKIISDEKYKLTLSSPIGPVFFTLVIQFKQIFMLKKKIEIGDMQFQLEDIKEFSPNLAKNDVVFSDGPIILTKNSENKKQFVISKGSEINKNNLIDAELFSSLFKSNLATKAKKLGLTIVDKLDQIPNPEIVSITKNGRTLEAVTTRMQIKPNSEDYYVVGNRIRMIVPFSEPSEIAEFEKLMDCGFGVMNGYGFGFMKKSIGTWK
jgi:CRISPR-associated endoribonuclease Cas6